MSDKRPDYKRIYDIVKKKFDQTAHFTHGPFDETYYTMRVYETAKEIIKRIKKPCDKEVILVAAILHDVGKTKLASSKLFGKNKLREDVLEEWHRHAKLGVSITKNVLKKLGHSDGFIDKVCYLVENHDMRGDKMKSRSIELKILQDADLLADEGIAGFIRPFLYGAKFKRPIIGSIKHIRGKERRIERRGQLNLSVSKKMAKEKLAEEAKIFKIAEKEIKSDLL